MTWKFWSAVGKLSVSKLGYQKLRDVLLWLRIVKHSGRQDFILGKLKQNISENDLQQFLFKKGFKQSFYSWIDDEEILSLRKMDRFIYQYHLRLYSDKEIRGHYEYAPDAYPWKHYRSHRFENRKKDFEALLKVFLK